MSIIAESIDEFLTKIEIAEKHNPDFIEIRLDKFEDLEYIGRISKSTNTPLIAANRSLKECGFFKGEDKKRIKMLIKAAKVGFDYVDIELSIKDLIKLVNTVRSLGSKVIISFHDFNKTPSAEIISDIFQSEMRYGADVCKIVTTARKYEDNLGLLNFIYNNHKKARIVCFAMGEIGKISRFISPIFGAYFTFSSLVEGEETAPGQFGIENMRNLYEKLGFIF